MKETLQGFIQALILIIISGELSASLGISSRTSLDYLLWIVHEIHPRIPSWIRYGISSRTPVTNSRILLVISAEICSVLQTFLEIFARKLKISQISGNSIVTLSLFVWLLHTLALFVFFRRTSHLIVSLRFKSSLHLTSSSFVSRLLFSFQIVSSSHVVFLRLSLSPIVSAFLPSLQNVSCRIAYFFIVSQGLSLRLTTFLYIRFRLTSSLFVSLHPSMPRIKSNHRFSYRVPLSPKRNAE